MWFAYRAYFNAQYGSGSKDEDMDKKIPAVEKLSANEARQLRQNNSIQTFDTLKKYNSKKLHNDKDRNDLTTPQKNERKIAKKRKVLLKEIGKKDVAELTDFMQELVASGERPLSQGPLETSPNTTLVRLERAHQDDSDESD